VSELPDLHDETETGIESAVNRAGADLAKSTGALLETILLVVLKLLPVALRAACVAMQAYAAWLTWPVVHQAFGGDAAAVIVATLAILVPPAFTLGSGAGWGGLVVSALITFGMGAVIPRVNPVVLSLTVPMSAGATFLYFAQKGANESEEQRTR